MKKILIYVGYQPKPFNYQNFKIERFSQAETAAYYLGMEMIKMGYDVTIGGEVINGEENGLKFKSLAILRNEMAMYDTIISSSYIHYLIELQDYVNFSKSFLWLHDIEYYDWWNGIQIPNSIQLLTSKKINGIVGLSKSHLQSLSLRYGYPTLYHLIEYGNNYSNINAYIQKDKNSYIYTSSSNKGLQLLLKIWPKVKQHKSDATLRIFTHPESENMEQFDFEQDGIILHANEPINILNMWMQKSEYWFCASDLNEIYGDDIIHAQLSRTYPIINDNSGLKEHSLHAIEVSHKNKNENQIIQEYVNKILSTNPLELMRARENNFNWVKDRTWEKTAKKWKILIDI